MGHFDIYVFINGIIHYKPLFIFKKNITLKNAYIKKKIT